MAQGQGRFGPGGEGEEAARLAAYAKSEEYKPQALVHLARATHRARSRMDSLAQGSVCIASGLSFSGLAVARPTAPSKKPHSAAQTHPIHTLAHIPVDRLGNDMQASRDMARKAKECEFTGAGVFVHGMTGTRRAGEYNDCQSIQISKDISCLDARGSNRRSIGLISARIVFKSPK
jgi:hypothetical protein